MPVNVDATTFCAGVTNKIVGAPPAVYVDWITVFKIVDVKARSVPVTRAVVPSEPAVPEVPPE